MNRNLRVALNALIAAALAGVAGCATRAQPPSQALAAAPPLAIGAPPPDAASDDMMRQWNLFPDPTTGHVEVYHEGKYVGAITGDEPASQDPPLPHHVDE
jgi:hypothetical protein